jgi:sulfoxide reductase heme-binding subunit YedZ
MRGPRTGFRPRASGFGLDSGESLAARASGASGPKPDARSPKPALIFPTAVARKPITLLKILIVVAGLIPAAALVVGLFTDALGANPVETITHQTGTTGLAFLLITLSVTPLRRISGWNELIRVRRMLGLFAFFYATLHVLTWAVLDHFFDPSAMMADVVKRPFITAGMTAYLLLVPLALTSTNGMIRRLGGRRWQQLHRLAYLAAIAVVVHFWWLVKADVTEPQRWALALTVLLGFRAWWTLRTRLSSRF